MKCRDCLEHLYEFLDRELTPQLEQEVREHIESCEPCAGVADFETLYLKFVQARCRSQGVPPELKRRILHELFGE
jgi:anti-sigma factor (TIGR02949 family)